MEYLSKVLMSFVSGKSSGGETTMAMGCITELDIKKKKQKEGERREQKDGEKKWRWREKENHTLRGEEMPELFVTTTERVEFQRLLERGSNTSVTYYHNKIILIKYKK